MSTRLYHHPSSLDHIVPTGHPERPARIEAIMRTLAAPEFAALDRHEAPEATDAQLRLAHPQAHIDAVRAAAPAEGMVSLDPDTHMSPGSLTAALHAAGAAIAAVDAVMDGEAGNAFCALRPPGHHAERARPMGFCLFGNIAIAAKHAIQNHGLARVAIIDFDVHHGNGTHDLVWDDAAIHFASTHQMPLYPGTGAADERGAHDNVLNVPLPPGMAGTQFRRAMEDQVLPFVDAHQPEILFISAGFDAHAADPLANLELVEDDFAWATAAICDLADSHAGGRVVSTLEGGYDLAALGASVAAHVSVLMERSQ